MKFNRDIDKQLKDISILAQINSEKYYWLSDSFYDSLYNFITQNIKYENLNWNSEAILDFYLEYATEEFNSVDDIEGEVVEEFRSDFEEAEVEIEKHIRRYNRKIDSFMSDETMDILEDFVMDIEYILDNLNAKVGPFLIKNYSVE